MSIGQLNDRRVAKRYSRTVTVALSEQLAGRVRSLLRSADHPAGASGTLQDWRGERDTWIDRLDPRNGLRIDGEQVRSLIDFLSEAGPSRASRKTSGEWNAEIDALVPELLFAAR